MTEEKRAEATEEMLRYYRARMKESNSIPMLCVGMGIGPQFGKATVCVPDNVPLKDVYIVLKQLVDMLETKVGGG